MGSSILIRSEIKAVPIDYGNRAKESRGYKLLGEPGRGIRKRKTLLTDEQVLECRCRSEFEGWDRNRLAEEYGVSRGYMTTLLDYTVRSKLIPRAPR